MRILEWTVLVKKVPINIKLSKKFLATFPSSKLQILFSHRYMVPSRKKPNAKIDKKKIYEHFITKCLRNSSITLQYSTSISLIKPPRFIRLLALSFRPAFTPFFVFLIFQPTDPPLLPLRAEKLVNYRN